MVQTQSGFVVEGVLMRGAALHAQEDDPLRPGTMMGDGAD